ncbi:MULTISPECIES: carbohydrate ABC transporter permease [Paenibacillus]|uniref:ABC transporter permease subunit n=1 Tax=Paenibacillus campinasensis TaxID=66347 RepID=A0ABW9T7B5_9BACL|nr:MULTISPECIES: carbohydrate ABC transporter permease [Paenibacillus]MUG68291.1 ABC transporter permease subunit [Paenibacillus campinasensis]PAK48046.1 ABC transporter permease [Paenibacillus sp. 7541]
MALYARLKQSIHHLVLAAASIMMAFPFIWMVSSALKTNEEIWSFPPTLLPEQALWHNFMDAWNAAPFSQYVWNSFFVATTIVLCQVVNSAMYAYAITHMRFRLKGVFTAAIVLGYMIPATATYLPSYLILNELNMLNSYQGLIFSNCVSVFSIFLIRQAFLQVSGELIEAGHMDGARHLTVLFRILVPLTKPFFAVIALITFIEQYNNYFWPMLITNDPNLHLVSAGLRSFFVEGGAYGLKWPLIMAASALTIAPLLVLFLFTQKTIIQSVNLSAGATKG